jgi:hypothetical protein
MGQARDRPLRSTQLDLDFGRFSEQAFETFRQLSRLCIPERNLGDFFRPNHAAPSMMSSFSDENPFSKRSTARSLPYQPPILLLPFSRSRQLAQKLTCTLPCGILRFGLEFGPVSAKIAGFPLGKMQRCRHESGAERGVRTEVGSNAVKKVRKAGRIPAVLYGHGEQNVNLSLAGDEVNALIRHGNKLVDLKGDRDGYRPDSRRSMEHVRNGRVARGLGASQLPKSGCMSRCPWKFEGHRRGNARGRGGGVGFARGRGGMPGRHDS